MSTTDLITSYDTRESRGVLGLRANLGLRGFYFRVFREKYVAQIADLLGGISGVVIDLGCNAGDKTGSLLRAFPERAITGVDIHENSIRKGTERYKGNSRVTMKIGNALELCSIVQGQIACVFTSQMLHHLNLEDRIICLDEIYKTLPNGGILVISDTFIDTKSNIGNLLKKGYMWLAKSDAYHNVSPEYMQEEAEFIGFKFVERIDSLPAIEKRIGFYPTTMFIFQKPLE